LLLQGHIENQTIPIVLPCTTNDKERLSSSAKIALCYMGKFVAVLKQPEIYAHRKEERCARVFGSTDIEHPHIKVGEPYIRLLMFFIFFPLIEIDNYFFSLSMKVVIG
jgi:ATP sulfurylase